MKFYKVVRKRTKHFKDLSSAITGHDYVLRYKTQVWRKPILKGSKIFVFDSIENAENFIIREQSFDIYSIYECEVKNPQRVTGIAYCPCTSDILKFWNYGCRSNLYPSGSYYADAVKLTKRIK